uniref:Uncharacterized protein n=1 Tax=Meloidogyne enterolobii TaxID=390850 RepID=A0A6V7XFZ6_MELEN|nr:unnamed protein product [Meloidogyne enterolobii]
MFSWNKVFIILPSLNNSRLSSNDSLTATEVFFFKYSKTNNTESSTTKFFT